jgi:poly(3-hydroxybutyrate) depolymerase
MSRTAQGLAADFAAAVSGGGAVASWLAVANDLLQLIATAIAIVAGLYALRWHKFRLEQGKKHLDKKQRMKQIERTIKELPDEDKS